MNQPEHVDCEELRPYVGKWVALDMSGAKERIVGSGETAPEAVAAAKAAGCPDACLFKVPGIPIVTLSNPAVLAAAKEYNSTPENVLRIMEMARDGRIRPDGSFD